MEMMINKRFYALMVCLMLLGTTATQAASIIGSKHDLSESNYYGASGSASTEICVFCHTPHNASTQAGLNEAPLWNRMITDLSAFTPYSSPSMTQTCPATPSGISLTCLSCHDGTSASGNLGAVNLSNSHNLVNPSNNGPSTPFFANTSPNCGACHGRGDGYYNISNPGDPANTPQGWVPGKWWQIGPDLSNDHPISMSYPMANPTNFVAPPDPDKGWADVKLFNGKVECPTCHNPHEPGDAVAGTAPFLRASNNGSALCLKCHKK